MTTSAAVRADSVDPDGVRITTLELSMPRFLLAQFNTHRAFSRNAQSSRAVPVEKLIASVEADPFVPAAFGKNQRGMSSLDLLTGDDEDRAYYHWNEAKKAAVDRARSLAELGVHKQLANRLLEPFSHVKVLVTATDWDNFFKLRLHHAAQPEMQELALRMKEAMGGSSPAALVVGRWHVPFGERMHPGLGLRDRLRVATARCARLSYASHDGEFSPERDFALHDDLLADGHHSPFEHCARCQGDARRYANFGSWASYRWLLENDQVDGLTPWDSWVEANA